MTICTTVSVSPPTPTPVPGMKTKLPTISTMLRPASPVAVITFPLPIIAAGHIQNEVLRLCSERQRAVRAFRQHALRFSYYQRYHPGQLDEQKDLLVAKTDELAGNTNTAVPLTFHHALTAIRFVCGDDMQGGTVKSVSLKNVCSKGTYNMGTQSWNNVDTPVTFSQTLNKSTTGTANEALTSDAQTFMMVPQTLPDGAQIEVVFTDNSNTDHTLTADIKGTACLSARPSLIKFPAVLSTGPIRLPSPGRRTLAMPVVHSNTV